MVRWNERIMLFLVSLPQRAVRTVHRIRASHAFFQCDYASHYTSQRREKSYAFFVSMIALELCAVYLFE